jgi:hypothetical protein
MIASFAPEHENDISLTAPSQKQENSGPLVLVSSSVLVAISSRFGREKNDAETCPNRRGGGVLAASAWNLKNSVDRRIFIGEKRFWVGDLLRWQLPRKKQTLFAADERGSTQIFGRGQTAPPTCSQVI